MSERDIRLILADIAEGRLIPSPADMRQIAARAALVIEAAEDGLTGAYIAGRHDRNERS